MLNQWSVVHFLVCVFIPIKLNVSSNDDTVWDIKEDPNTWHFKPNPDFYMIIRSNIKVLLNTTWIILPLGEDTDTKKTSLISEVLLQDMNPNKIVHSLFCFWSLLFLNKEHLTLSTDVEIWIVLLYYPCLDTSLVIIVHTAVENIKRPFQMFI